MKNNNSEEEIIEEIISSEFGLASGFVRYNPEPEVPMRYLLNTVKNYLNVDFSIYWVTGGKPKIFCLDIEGASEKVLVFSSRYVALSKYIKLAIFSLGISDQLVERVALETISEMALKNGYIDIAISAFMKQLIGKTLAAAYINDHISMLDLELSKKTESYVVLVLFGLAHEIGHFMNEDTYVSSFNISEILLERQIKNYTKSMPTWVIDEILSKFHDKKSDSCIEATNLIQECQADIVACNILFDTSIEMFEDYKEHEFDLDKFIMQILSYQGVVGFIHRCERISQNISDYSIIDLELEAMHVASHVRSINLMDHLYYAVTSFLYQDITEENFLLGKKKVDSVALNYFEIMVEAELGFRRVFDFIYTPSRIKNHWYLLEKYKEYLLKPNAFSLFESGRFISKLNSTTLKSNLSKEFVKITRNPSSEILRSLDDKLIFSFLWVSGPDEYSQPFLFQTEKGNSYFVFLDYTPIFEGVYQYCLMAFTGQYKLLKVSINARNRDDLYEIIASELYEKSPFELVFEETEEFNYLITKYMPEISNLL